MKVLFTTIFFFCLQCVQAQKGSVKIYQKKSIDSLIIKQSVINSTINDVYGYRIQIKNTTTQSEANRLRAVFSKNFPELKSYLNYDAPYYKIRIGDYLSKMTAQKELRKVKKKYTGAYLVPCGISFNEIMNKRKE